MSHVVQPSLSEDIAGAVIYAGLGAFAASAFTTINPLAGAIFGATSSLGTRAIDWILNKMGLPEDTSAGKIIKFAISFFGGIAIGGLAVSVLGFPMTFAGGVVLSLWMLGTTFAVSLLFIACVTSTVTATVIALNSSELREEFERIRQQNIRT